MTTLNKIIYDIREKLKINSDDIDITNDYIAHLVNVKRALLAKQRFGKFSKNVPEELQQTLCLGLDKASVKGTCFKSILKTTVKIPNFIETFNRDSFIDIRLYDLTQAPINIVSYQRIPFLGYNKWTKNQIYGAYHDKYLYLYSNRPDFKLLKNIKVTGLFADPEYANTLNCNSDVDCDFFQKEYPVNPPMVSDIVNMVVKELGASIQLKEDKLNNADESPR